MSKRPDQEMIDYWSSAEHVLNRIAEAIRAGDDFRAATMILTAQGTANASFQLWSAGPEQGQQIITEWMDQHGLTWTADNTLTQKDQEQ